MPLMTDASLGETAPLAPDTADRCAAGSPTPRWFWPAVGLLVVLGGLGRWLQVAEFVARNPLAERPWSDGWVYWQMAGRIASGHLWPDTPFFSAPLYPYLLALLRRLGGTLTAVYYAQLALHLGTALLIALAARRRLGHAAATLAAGLFLLLADPAVSVTRVLANTLQVFLFALLWWRWDALLHRGYGYVSIVLAAIVCGLCVLAYPAAMLVAVVLAFDVLAARPRPDRRVLRTAAFVIATAICIAPATWHNWRRDGGILVSANAGLNLALGNNPRAAGIAGNLPDIRPMRDKMFADAARVYQHATGRPGTWRQIDRFYRRQALDFFLHDPGAAAVNLLRKAWYFLAARDYDEMMPHVVERELGYARRWWLTPLPAPLVIWPAVVAGLLALRHGRRYLPELTLLCVPLLTVVIFFYTARYRMPALPAACALAAWLLVAALRQPARRRLAATAGVLATALLATWPAQRLNAALGVDQLSAEYREHFVRAYSETQTIRADRLLAADQPDRAEPLYRDALRLWPDGHLAHVGLGRLLARRGRLPEAIEHFRAAAGSAPDYRPAWYYLYNALCVSGDYQQALAVLLELSRRFDDPPAVAALAWLRAACPDERVRNATAARTAARGYLAAAQAGRAPLDDALMLQAAAQARAGDFTAAVATARRALEIARRSGHARLIRQLQRQLENYRAGRPVEGQPRLLRPEARSP